VLGIMRDLRRFVDMHYFLNFRSNILYTIFVDR
jgi:hypothetical protein